MGSSQIGGVQNRSHRRAAGPAYKSRPKSLSPTLKTKLEKLKWNVDNVWNGGRNGTPGSKVGQEAEELVRSRQGRG